MKGQILFVIWRESIEALLLIGIIYAWIKQNIDSRNGLRYLWGGVVIGISCSILLALLIYGVFNVLNDTGQSLFMIFMELSACVLIVQMVYWMNSHSHSMKSDIVSGLEQKTGKRNWWGVTFIVAIAIAREGSEIVVFLSGFIMSLNANNAVDFFAEVAGGIVIAALTLYLFSLINHHVPWRVFFNTTGVLLLFLAVSLLLKGAEESINLLLEYDYSIPDFLYLPAWNTTGFIDDSGIVGNLLNAFFGYRSQPIWLSVIVFVSYWVVIVALFVRRKKHA